MASSSRARLAAFFDADDDVEDASGASSVPVKRTEIEQLKMNTFNHGIRKKSQREKEAEVAEQKRQQEEQDAARAYAEFVQSFDVDTSKRGSNAFVRAGEAPKARVERAPVFNDEYDAPSASSAAAGRPKGKRAMDTYLEKIKQEQAEREARLKRSSDNQGRSVSSLAATEMQTGSRDRGDTETSNLFVANLPLHVTEPALGNFFSRHGPVGSVKIMWPRAADGVERRQGGGRSAGLSGFVSFMKRKDAEDALRELDGIDWGGSILRVGWSKAVALSAKPLYDARALTGKDREPSPERSSKRRGRDRSRSRERSRRHSRSRSHSRSHSRSRSRSRDRSRRHYSRRSHSHSRSRSRSRSPRRRSASRSRSPRRRSRSRERRKSSFRSQSLSPSRSPPRVAPKRPAAATGEADETESFMRMVARMVKSHGQEFESTLRERETGKPHFGFMWDAKSPFYRQYHRLLDADRAPDDLFDEKGANSVYSTDSAEDSERERSTRGRLGPIARKRFERMLRALSGRRGEVGRCMVFALDHAEAASELADLITSALLVDATPVPRKVARLFLICDILHNSAASVPFAWKFRGEFQARLGLVFDHLSTIYHSFPGRITAETFKRQITSVVDVWEDWIVFPPDFTTELRLRLDGTTEDLRKEEETVEQMDDGPAEPVQESRFKSSTFQPAAVVEAAVTPGPEDDLDGAPLDDMDGEPLDDVDGMPLDDVDGEPLDDVDGAPLDEDLDGAPLEEDLDGAPLVDDMDGSPLKDSEPTAAHDEEDEDDRMHESD